MATVKKTSLSIYPNTMERVKERGPVSTVIERDINRLYDLYSRALRQVDLTSAEAHLICDLLASTHKDVNLAVSLHWDVEDGNNLDHLDEKWGVDGPAFVQKIAGLSEIQKLALVDAAERVWEFHDGKDFTAWVDECFMVKKEELK